MTNILLGVVSVIVVVFGFVIVFGAPYLPSKESNIRKVLDRLKIKPGQKLVDLGSGDGNVQIIASEYELKTSGYELNPLLIMISKFRLRKDKNNTVKWGNFWNHEIPTDTDYVYVFLHTRFMERLDEKMIAEVKKPITLISFGFPIPNKQPVFEEFGYFVYRYDVAKEAKTE